MSLKNYLDDANKPKSQTEKADPRQVQNNAGGFTFAVDDRTRLERFIILGTDGGTYYVDEQDLTKQNVDWLIELIKRDANGMVIDRAADISYDGRALRNDAAIFLLELVFQHGSDELKKAARNRFHSIVRTSYHLFQSNEFAEKMGGAWSRARKTAVQQWYTDKTPDQLAYQAVKYRQRDGWTHRDVFRLAHPTGIQRKLGDFILGKNEVIRDDDEVVMPDIINGFHMAQAAENLQQILTTLDMFPHLPWEAIPTQFHKEPDVWKKLFHNGKLTGQALVWNITRLSRIGAFKDMVFAREYADKLTDEEMIQKTRLHPFNYLNALVVHEHGQVWRPKKPNDRPPAGVVNTEGALRVKDWNTVPVLIDALNAGFYTSFKHVEPAGKRTLIGVDVSGSMSWGCPNKIDITCAQAAAAMSMAIARTEPYHQVFGFAHDFRDLRISPQMNLTQVLQRTSINNFGSTDCALPMVHALQNKIEVDTFVVVTDDETWAGRVHPHIALRDYRQKMGIGAKLVVVGMAATNFTIADPKDAGMLDVVGMDAGVPKLINEFAKSGF